MTEKLSCNVVQDLLPMYVDQLLTPESEVEVRKHLKECESCRRVCERMKRPEAISEEDIHEVDYLKKIRRGRIKLLIGACLAATVIAAGSFLFFKAQAGKTVVNYDEDSRTIVVYGKKEDTNLTLPEKISQAQNLDAQYESFHMSVELNLLRTDDQPLDEYLSAYLNRTNQSLRFLRKFLKDNCTGQYPYERAAKYVDISILTDGDYTWSELEDRIRLEMGGFYWHREELYLLSLLGSRATEWKQLGYAWYLGLCIDPYSEVLVTTSMNDLGERLGEVYKRGGGTDEQSPENYRILTDAASYICLTEGMYWGSAYESIPLKDTALYHGPKKIKDPGNEMSVCMATSFIAFLSDTYGFDKVSTFCFGEGSFEENFQTDFQSAYSDWTEWTLASYS